MRELLNDVSDPHSSNHEVPVLPLVAIFVVGFLGLSGSLLPPLLASYFPKFDLNGRVYFRFFNGFAAGIVLAVGYVHSLPDAFSSFAAVLDKDSLSNTYAWAGLIALIGSLLTFAGEEFVHRMIGHQLGVHPFTIEHQHSHGHMEVIISDAAAVESPTAEGGDDSIEEKQKKLSYYSELYVLLFGLSFHSIFVGLALGIVSNDWSLFTAIVFHQFFEGLALGARVARAAFKSRAHIWMLDLVFGLAAPVGIAMGIGVRKAVENSAFTYGLVDAVFQALSGGILIYVSLVHMMKEEMDRPEFKKGGKLMWAMYAGFAMGAATMSIIGIWA